MHVKSKEIFSRHKTKIVVFLAIALGLAAVMLAWGGRLHSASDTGNNATDETPRKNDGTIDIPGYETLSFRAGSKKQEVYFFNPVQNDCYFQISILTDDGSVLWRSDFIEPGEEIKRLELNEELEAGSFSAILQYDCFSRNDKSALNGARENITIHVEGKEKSHE